MKFYKILRKSQKDLKKAIRNEWAGYGYDVIEGDGWLYKEGTFPVLLVAHMDTVHERKPTTIHKKNNVLSSPQGIGGDDRCGIFITQEVIKKYDCAVVLTEDEEIGCIGAGKFADSELAKSLKGRFCYIIEFDRRGKNDAVFYSCDNYEFEDFITEKYWKTQWGSYSDICEIAPVLKAAAVNLSCGYYDEHQKKETIRLDEMNATIREACNLLARTDETKKFEYVEMEPMLGKSHDSFWNWSGHKSFYEEEEYVVQYCDKEGILDYKIVYAISDYEAVGMFLADHDTLTYKDIYDVSLYEDLFEYGYGLEA